MPNRLHHRDVLIIRKTLELPPLNLTVQNPQLLASGNYEYIAKIIDPQTGFYSNLVSHRTFLCHPHRNCQMTS